VAAVKGHPEASSARVIREVATGGLRLALSDAFLSEVAHVMKDPEVDRSIGSAGRAFEIALDLGVMGVLYRPRRYDWPSLRDSNDWWLLDLAFEAGADFIVTWDPDLLDYASDRGEPHGFDVLTPPRLLQKLSR
jgi:putative PIN family toxin of toxin-antitoxin system